MGLVATDAGASVSSVIQAKFSSCNYVTAKNTLIYSLSFLCEEEEVSEDGIERGCRDSSCFHVVSGRNDGDKPAIAEKGITGGLDVTTQVAG